MFRMWSGLNFTFIQGGWNEKEDKTEDSAEGGEENG